MASRIFFQWTVMLLPSKIPKHRCVLQQILFQNLIAISVFPTVPIFSFECLCNGQSWIPAAAIIMDWIKLRSFLNSHTTKTCYNLIITWCSSIKSLFRTTSSTLHLLILVPMQTCQTIIIKKNEMRHPKEQRPRSEESKRLIFSKSVEITEQ